MSRMKSILPKSFNSFHEWGPLRSNGSDEGLVSIEEAENRVPEERGKTFHLAYLIDSGGQNSHNGSRSWDHRNKQDHKMSRIWFLIIDERRML